MVDQLGHRGPDDSGVFIDNKVGIGHTRLSILDLSDAGHQPMKSRDGRLTICFNGEVYNFRELRSELVKQGYQIHSGSDTEVVLAAYEAWGIDCLKRLNGMFALAIWDSTEQKLLLTRDRFGIKPLYYRLSNERLLFASEPKSILAVDPQQKIDWSGLHQYLHFGSSLGETTLFDGIKRLPPGVAMVYDPHRHQVEQMEYANLADIEPLKLDYESAKTSLKQKLDQAVKSHLVSDVPVGVFLSGGIDSACITAFASRHYEGTLATYSAAFDFD